MPGENRKLELLIMRRAVALLSATSSNALLGPHDSPRVVGNCLVARRGDTLRLELLTEPGNVQSEWDLAGATAPDYAGTMAHMARAALAHRAGPQRVLLLGLGGGTIAADLLLHDRRLHVTAIERDADVAAAAREVFIPAMLPPVAREKIDIVLADAVERILHRRKAGVAPHAREQMRYDVILEDFAYESPGLLHASFWRALRQDWAANDCTLLINTLYPHCKQMDDLACDLADGGWTGLRQRVDRGLQVLPGVAGRRSNDPSTWQPRDNMIFSATSGVTVPMESDSVDSECVP